MFIVSTKKIMVILNLNSMCISYDSH
jgi:hypothetical protein